MAVNALSKSAHDVCRSAGVGLADVDWMVPHQANVRILNFLGKKLGIPTEKIVITLDQHANTSAASVPLALDVARRDGRIKKGMWYSCKVWVAGSLGALCLPACKITQICHISRSNKSIQLS